MTILEKIIANKIKEVAELKKYVTLKDLEKSRHFPLQPVSLSGSLSDRERSGIIAEFKRMSPSKGIINSGVNVQDVTTGYSREGASGLSVLTDKKFFGGSVDDLLLVRDHNSIPILRKDFIIDEFQVVESKAAGADVILLIAAALKKSEVSRFASLSRSLGMEVILEVHSASELEAINEHIDIIGVNNRDLKTFNTDINLSVEMVDMIPGEFCKISESGILLPSTVKYLRQNGYDGFLIGELFMASNDPVASFSDFVREISCDYA
jgi:indole-3-glycerol phosphate synthase